MGTLSGALSINVNPHQMNREKWIALAEVVPITAFSGLEQPAYVNVVGLAQDEASFLERIRQECEQLDLQLVGVEDVETWAMRISKWQPEDEIVTQAASVSEDTPFCFGTFFCFDEE